MVNLTINGTPHAVDADDGCGIAACGACTVHLDSSPCARARRRSRMLNSRPRKTLGWTTQAEPLDAVLRSVLALR